MARIAKTLLAQLTHEEVAAAGADQRRVIGQAVQLLDARQLIAQCM
jgi:hypothetical protein